MPKKKNLLYEILDFLKVVTFVYVLLMGCLWFFNRAAFWKWLFYGVPFFVIISAIIVAIVIWWKKTKFLKIKGWHSGRELLYRLRGMKPWEFEEYIAELFTKMGYKTKVRGGSYDKGIDVIAEKDGIKHYIQCKKYFKRKVGVAEVREFYGSMADFLANGKGMFIATSKFTIEAEKFAEDKPMELIDEFKLIKYIRLAEKSKNKSDSKVCPKCGGKLEERVGKYGKFLGCSNYPKCQYTENIKK